MLTGGGLSKRFTKLPLWVSHPANIGAFYGLLVSIALIMPYWMTVDHWGALWIFHSSGVILACLLLGTCSRIINIITKRMPITPPRKLLYPMPFLGFTLLTINSTELLTMPSFIPWFLLLLPGPLYVHLSWAPRWRLLCHIDDGKAPLDWMDSSKEYTDTNDLVSEDNDLIEVVEEFESEE
jgi:hypothetical protein